MQTVTVNFSGQHLSWQHLSISGIYQLLLTRFWPNFKGRFLGQSITDAKCHGDIFPGNIFPGIICPFPEYLSCCWPNNEQTFWTQLWGLNDNIFCSKFFWHNFFWPQNVFEQKNTLNPNFFEPHIFDWTFFLTQHFLVPKFVDLISLDLVFLTNNFFNQKYFPYKFSAQKRIPFNQKFLLDPNYIGQ